MNRVAVLLHCPSLVYFCNEVTGQEQVRNTGDGNYCTVQNPKPKDSTDVVWN